MTSTFFVYFKRFDNDALGRCLHGWCGGDLEQLWPLCAASLEQSDRIPMPVRKASKSLPESELALRAIAMPMFANAHGDIFGGWLLSQMDLAGSAVAVRRANGRVVTVAVTAMSFQCPVFVGDEVSCYAKVLKVGRTSITVKVEAFARRGRSGKQIQVTEGVFTYVAVDSESKPRPV